MTPSLRLNPFRAIPVAFALIFNVVFGPMAPFIQSQLTGPTSALAYVGDSGTFELDGNAFHAGSSHDWDQVFADRNGPPFSASDANNVVFATDITGAGDDILTGGSTKDINDIPSWLWKQSATTSVQDKDDIENAFAAAYTATNGHTVGYFGLDRYSIDGDATAGFWFFKDGVAKSGLGGGNGTGFTGQHTEGDILVVIDFVNGGSSGEATVYYWHNGALTLKTTGGECDGSQQDACAITNTQDANSPWSYTPKSGTANVFPAADVKQNGSQGAGALYEGGIDLTALGLDTGCFSSFMAETRSSQEPTSTLSDFVLGNFSFCAPPVIETQVSDSAVSVGDTVTDTASLSGDKGAVEGTVDFFLCGPNGSAPDCSTGGTKVGATKTISNGEATSDAFTATTAGFYCFRAAYTPVEGSKYLATSHTNKTTECFEVKPAEVHVTKTADAASVSAGDDIGFTVTVSNTGTGTAKGVALADALPGGNAGHPVHWVIDTSQFDYASFALGGADGSQQLTLAGQPIAMAAGASLKVHLTAHTDETNCAVYDNTASVSSTNDGSDSDSASTQVLCPALSIQKTADATPVSAGDAIGFWITVSNSSAAGTGTAKDVTLSDPLPAGVTWSISPAYSGPGSCVINANTLSCSFGDMAPGASASVHVSATTSAQACSTYPNTATADADNHAQIQASATIECLSPSIHVSKSADNATVNAGEEIGFTVTVSNTGAGEAKGVTLTDALPGGNAGDPVHWVIDGTTGDFASFTISGLDGSQQLTLAGQPITMAAGASLTVHVTAATDSTSCAQYDNTASVSTSNDGSDSDDASTTVLCPDVKVVKTADDESVSAGEDIGFTITVSNIGDGDAADVTLTDTLPSDSGLSWSIDGGTGAADCDISAGVLTCDFGTMASGASKSVHISSPTSGESCGTIENTASVSASNEPESVLGNNEDSDSTDVICPDVTVLKTADNGTISAGDTAAFTIVVSNAGEGMAYDVTLDDTLPTGVDWSEDSDSCSITSGVLSCDFGDMASGASATIHVWGETDAADCGVLHNEVTVAASNEAQADTENNWSSADITVECPDLTATKTADASPVSAGSQIGFTITVSNSDDQGTGTAHDVTLNDPLPAGSDLAWSIDDQPAGNPCSITGSAGSQTLECSFGDMAPGDSVSVHVVSDTSKADCSTLPNVASVTASNHDELNPEADVTVECPGLNIAKTAAESSINGGDQAGFTIVVWNTGPGTALNVTLDDPLPGGLAWTDDSEDCSITSGTLHCDFGDLGVTTMENTPATVTVTAPTTRTDCGTLDNLATASADNNDDVEASASIDVTCPVIRIQKVNDQVASVLPGTVVTYTLTVTVEDGPALNAEVVDTLPAGLDDPTAISDGGTWSSADRTITWQFASLDGLKELSYKAAVSDADTNGQVLTNVAVVTSQNTQCPNVETLGEECTDDSTVTVRVPTLVIEKAASIDEVHFVYNADGTLKSVTPADRQVTWTLTYTLENGPVTDAVISDPLPAHLTFVSADNGGTYDSATRTITWHFATLDASGTLSFVTTVDTDAPDGAIDNVATISSAETPEDTGEDSVLVTEEQVEAATPTPKPSVPNTALALSQNGEPIQVPIELLILVLISSLGTLTLVNVKAARRRR